MKNKLICLLLVLAMMFGTLVVLSSCNGGGDDTPADDQGKTDGGNTDGGNTDGGKTDGGSTEGGNTCENPVDADSDGKCDNCGKSILGHDKGAQKADWWEDITYENTSLIFELNNCSNSEELPSGCECYLQGDAEYTKSIDPDLANMINERNINCYDLTNVTVEYRYLGEDAASYGWSKNIDRIYEAVLTKAKNSPDMYCNYMTDMLCASLKGSFANLYSRAHGDNYMNISEDGYMSELMSSLTLSLEKIYVVASDYFIDLIRAFFVVPVNRKVFESNCIYSANNEDGITDLDGDGEININDLFAEVKNQDWTYERIAEYSAMAYAASGEGAASLNDEIGFAVSAGSGLSPAGLLYTTTVSIIHKNWDSEKGDFVYEYPETNQQLLDFCSNLYTLFSQSGVIGITNAESCGYGSSAMLAIRERFSTDHVLFGGVILLGSLEYDEYQGMKDSKNGRGFGILPVPLYHKYETNADGSYVYYELDSDGEYKVDEWGDYVVVDNATELYTTKVNEDGTILSDGNKQVSVMKDSYLTQIHVMGRAGAIAVSTTKFSQCTAFIQYQSTHSTDILNDYYKYEMMENTSDTSITGNVDILKYIRNNVRTSFDKLYEDGIGFFYETTDAQSSQKRWHALIADPTTLGTNKYHCNPDGPFRMTDMATIYESLQSSKNKNLQSLVEMYEVLPE